MRRLRLRLGSGHRFLWGLLAAAVVIAAAAAGAALGGGGAVQVASSGGWSLVRTADGLLTYWSFERPVSDRVLQDSFEFNGDSNPSLAFVTDPGGGLRVGVYRHPQHTYEGWFAVTLNAFPASGVYHTELIRPPGDQTGPGRASETVFAVQTASTKITALINFVEVTSDSLNGRTGWAVDYSHGKVRNSSADVLWQSPSLRSSPVEEAVTLRTNGRNTLSVWFGPRLVYSSRRLHMNMEAPFQPYLEVQSRLAPYVARFRDFWVTSSSDLFLQGLPGGMIAQLRSAPGGPLLAAATASAGGDAVLRLPPPEAVGRGVLELVLKGRRRVVLGPFEYAGGDHFRLEQRTGSS